GNVLLAQAIRYLPGIEHQASPSPASHQPVGDLNDLALGMELLPVTGINHHILRDGPSAAAPSAPQPWRRGRRRVPASSRPKALCKTVRWWPREDPPTGCAIAGSPNALAGTGQQPPRPSPRFRRPPTR